MAKRLGRILAYVVGESEIARETDGAGGYSSTWRHAFVGLSVLVLLAAMTPLLASMAPEDAAWHVPLMAAVVLTEPFIWSILVRDRTRPWTYLALLVLNLAALVAFFAMHHQGDHTPALYFIIVLAAFDFAADTPALNRVVPLVLVLALMRTVPIFPLSVGIAMGGVLVVRELRVHLQNRHRRSTLEDLRAEIVEAKDAGYRDELTGLYNRRVIPDRIEGLFEYCREEGEPFGLILLDIDHLKEANDTHGHQFGDEVIAHVGEVILSARRPGDFAIRYGGDEFMLVTTGVGSYAGLEAISSRLADRVRERPFGGFGITLSIGCVLSPDTPVQDLQDAVRLADRSLYAAKRRGRDRTVRADDPDVFES